MKRLLVCALRFFPDRTYGAEVYFSSLLTGLSQVNLGEFEIGIAASSSSCKWVQQFYTGIKTIPLQLPQSSTICFILELLLAQKIASKWRADAVFFPFNFMPSMRTPSILMVHDLVNRYYLKEFPGYRTIDNTIRWRFLQRSIQNAHIVVSPTQAIANEILTLTGGLKPIRTNSESVQTSCEITDMPESFVSSKEYILLLSGSKAPHKSQHTAVLALSELKRLDEELFSNTELLVTGGNKVEQTELKSLSEKSEVIEHVRFLGKVSASTLSRVQKAATLHLFPTLYEGFGLGVLEAQSLGKAIVASDIAVLREVSGGHGSFFPPGNATEMAIRIQELLRHTALRENLAQKGRTHSSSWTWNKHAHQLLQIVAELDAL